MDSEGRAGRSPDRWEVEGERRGVEDGTQVSGLSNRMEGLAENRRGAGMGVNRNGNAASDLVV